MARERGILSFGFMALIALLLMVSSFFTPIPNIHTPSPLPYFISGSPFFGFITGHGVVSVILALLFLSLMCISLYYINDSYFLVANESEVLPVVYLILIFSNPQSVYFSAYHVAAFLILWALYFDVRYHVEEEKKMNSLFINVMLFSLTSLIIPSLFWLVIFLFFINLLSLRMNFVKYLIIFISAAILPFIYLFSIRYIFFRTDFIPFVHAFGEALADVSFVYVPQKISYLFMIGMITIVAFRSFLFLLRRKNDFSNTSAKAFIRGFLFMIVILLTTFMFFSSNTSNVQLILYIPVSLMIFAFIRNKESLTQARGFFILLILSILIGRVSYFI